MKILITGGHLMPALAVIDKILSLNKENRPEVVFVGRKYNLDSEQSHSLEYQEISKRQIEFIPLVTGKLRRNLGLKSLRDIIMIFLGLFNALKIVNSVKPGIILSFGGYLGFPFVFWGFVKKIPVYSHEQTLNPGLANRVSNYFARKIFVSFPQTKKYFSSDKVIVTGNPVRSNIFIIDKKPFTIDKTLPVIYFTGGSLGSHALNVHVGDILKELLADFIIIHQTGNIKEHDDYQKLIKIKQALPMLYQKRYFLREHFFSNEIAYVFSLSDLFVSRAGANTFFELVALKKPAILVPLPWAVNQEQQKQAELFVVQGLGEIFSQFETSGRLLNLIKQVYKNIGQYKNNFNQLQSLYKQDAAETIIQTILSP